MASKTVILLNDKNLRKLAIFFQKMLLKLTRHLPIFKPPVQEFSTAHLNSFNPINWQKIPFSSKSDILNFRITDRLKNIRRLDDKNFYFKLGHTSGTATARVPVVLLQKIYISSKIKNPRPRKIIYISSSFSNSLNEILVNVLHKRKWKNRRSTIIILTQSIPKAHGLIATFSPTMIHADPSDLANSAINLSKIDSIKKLRLYGNFLSPAESKLLRYSFPGCEIKIVYGLEEFGRAAAQSCNYISEKYDWRAYHPYKNRGHIIELIDIDENGVGEVVLTRLKPISVALIRYRTGDMGRVIEEKCECGADFTLILEGRKNYDFIKLAGALLTRTELERVIGNFASEIEDWRAEVGEKLTAENTLINELKIKIKLHLQDRNLIPNSLNKISSYISDNLFMTPSKTFADLVHENRFLPLKIEVVENFPQTAKILKITKSP